MTLEALNQLDRSEFVAAVGWIFEHSPWVSERAYDKKPFRDMEALHGAMIAEVAQARSEEQLALLRAHPDLGTRAKLSDASASEQSGVGLDQLTPQELDRFTQLNDAYVRKFGFPFLFAVKGSTKFDILQALEQRLTSTRGAEFEEALRQVYRIADFRLRDYLKQED